MNEQKTLYRRHVGVDRGPLLPPRESPYVLVDEHGLEWTVDPRHIEAGFYVIVDETGQSPEVQTATEQAEELHRALIVLQEAIADLSVAAKSAAQRLRDIWEDKP